jgi:flagellar motor switch protein FliM
VPLFKAAYGVSGGHNAVRILETVRRDPRVVNPKQPGASA